jgi:hypothetical protein
VVQAGAASRALLAPTQGKLAGCLCPARKSFDLEEAFPYNGNSYMLTHKGGKFCNVEQGDYYEEDCSCIMFLDEFYFAGDQLQ